MMIELLILLLAAAAAAILGGGLGALERVHPQWMQTELRHAIIAFGGGALFSAVALVLVPKGMAQQPSWTALLSFALGAIVFMSCDRYFTNKGTPLSQLLAMLLDFVPEAIVVGAVITSNYSEAVFLTVVIAAQNFPEAFNAYREITHAGKGGFMRKHGLLVITIAALSGVGWGLFGLFAFEADSASLGTLMTFCAGGIVYLIFRDVAPQATLERHWYPSLGAVAGFMVGMAGHAVVG
ncbi:ZIP family metal transporter [Hyphococcus sp.]|uniref:ZIP family metal transporter n=1 Tax=Hyphococcus sp. TaxID=2038636 RepID=UPI003CCBB889